MDAKMNGSENEMSDFNTSIIEEFRANEGRVGGDFEGSPLILIHHIGAKSGAERVTPLGCFPQSDGRLVIVASNGGAVKHPNWYHNLKANPEIRVEFGTEIFCAEVKELEGSDRRKVWTDAVDAVPILREYQRNTLRSIPVLVLTRVS
jgi:deazaflavin-dependent oxidoreductase (nitroreductase family)